MIFINNFVLALPYYLQPTWKGSIINGIYLTLYYLVGILVVSMVVYIMLRSLDKKNRSFNRRFNLSLSFTSASFIGFLIESVFFILFWTWLDREYDPYYITQLPEFLIPFATFFLLFIVFLIWFLFERHKKLTSKDPSSSEDLFIDDEIVMEAKV